MRSIGAAQLDHAGDLLVRAGQLLVGPLEHGLRLDQLLPRPARLLDQVVAARQHAVGGGPRVGDLGQQPVALVGQPLDAPQRSLALLVQPLERRQRALHELGRAGQSRERARDLQHQEREGQRVAHARRILRPGDPLFRRPRSRYDQRR